MVEQKLRLKKVRVHNLKGVNLELEPGKLIVFSGVSGSGKSSMAFDTIFAEGQRRYVESLSTHTQRYLENMPKPDAESIEGITPTISIEQKAAGKNPRSTVGTLTEIYDYLRVLYARVGIPHCPVSGESVRQQSVEHIVSSVQALPEGTKILILAPYARGKKAEFREDFQHLLRKGFIRVRVDGEVTELDEHHALDGKVAHDVDVVVDRLVVRESDHQRIADSVNLALEMGEGLCLVLKHGKDDELIFSRHAYSPKSGLSYGPLDPQHFSFNSPAGMCEACHGLARIQDFDLDKIIDPEKSIADDCCILASSATTVRYGNIYRNLARLFKFSTKTPWKKLSEEAKKIFLYGIDRKWIRMSFVHPVSKKRWTDYVAWKGVLWEARKRYAEAKSESYRKRMEALMREGPCHECHGERLKPYPRACLLGGKRISEISGMTVRECSKFFEALTFEGSDQVIAEELLKELRQRLKFLLDVGLHYLTLDRTAPTLSGGEAQRVRLASQVGCGLVGVTYILDEPSIGLHPRDNRHLIQTLQNLRDRGNTVIVVEHDEETLLAADEVVDFGPGAGVEGGSVVAQGPLKKVAQCPESLTAQYLLGKRSIALPKERRVGNGESLILKGARHHNLKSVSAEFPLGCLIAVTGVSGSGKSSLITETLAPLLTNRLHHGEQDVGEHDGIEGLEHIDKVIGIDQSPIGRIPRSNPSTYIKLFDLIRDLFTELPESRARGYRPGQFSFNVAEGSCQACKGMGMVKVDMDFMEDAWVTCSACDGRRFDEATLSVLFKGKSIYDVLEMSVTEACAFFQDIPKLKKKLQTLQDVGLGYLSLGQSSPSLSGGEAQRVKLAKELSRPATGRTLYILDEPTTGLHFHDIYHLLNVIKTIVDRGNTVVVIEHNMEVVKVADWVIDLGPDGGQGGGKIVASGTPEALSKKKSPTGEAIRQALAGPLLQNLGFPKVSAKKAKKGHSHLKVRDASQHNLKHVDVEIPRGKISVFSGPSGSGKSSLAFDTIYAEGQRRYSESLSPYARQFVRPMPKPKVGQVEGLSPAIAIEQKHHAGNPRSTVGTMTEIYDFLKILYARLGQAHCPETGEPIRAISKEHVLERFFALPEDSRVRVLAPIHPRKGESSEQLIQRLARQGFVRVRLDGQDYEISEPLPFQKGRKHSLELLVDRLIVRSASRQRVYEAIQLAAKMGEGKLILALPDRDLPFNLSFAVESTGKAYPEISSQTFSFNHAEGMCLDCFGLGYQVGVAAKEIIKNPEEKVGDALRDLLKEDCLEAFPFILKHLESIGIPTGKALCELSSEQRQTLFFGEGEAEEHESPYKIRLRWIGLSTLYSRLAKGGNSFQREMIHSFVRSVPCLSCGGSRLNPLARHVILGALSLPRLCQKPISGALEWVKKLKISGEDRKVLEEVLRQIETRLSFLVEVGLDYVSLNRTAPSLSGGETQRIRLARQLGSSLTGVLYVLDEPTIGLHPSDTDRLNQALCKLKNLNNSLLMVEHDPLCLKIADHLVDFGPGSGSFGGEITAAGTLKQIQKNPKSLTGAYLSGKRGFPTKEERREGNGNRLSLPKSYAHNLKGIQVDIPLGLMTCITGVSGSGKSTLMEEVLLPTLKKNEELSFLHIDQNPVGHTVRSCVGSYADALPALREFFAALSESKKLGLRKKNFSFNHKKGMCTACSGLGVKRVEMHFLPPVQVLCDQCKGKRLQGLSLQVLYKEKNFGDYLQMSVDELLPIFDHLPKVKRILKTLHDVGLGYLQLGQEVQTLSGGESQRLKLSRELAKRRPKGTFYLLDEPSTGLHAEDVRKLLDVLDRLVDKGHSVVAVEHHLEIIAHADHVIDLGPGPGDAGGKLVFSGSPEKLAKCPDSETGKYLAPILRSSSP